MACSSCQNKNKNKQVPVSTPIDSLGKPINKPVATPTIIKPVTPKFQSPLVLPPTTK